MWVASRRGDALSALSDFLAVVGVIVSFVYLAHQVCDGRRLARQASYLVVERSGRLDRRFLQEAQIQVALGTPVQVSESFHKNEGVLDAIDHRHAADEPLRALDLLVGSDLMVNIDLIYGLPDSPRTTSATILQLRRTVEFIQSRPTICASTNRHPSFASYRKGNA